VELAASEYELDGKVYVWTGSRWYGKRDFVTPPAVTINRLNRLVGDAQDAKVVDPDEMVKRAQYAREHGQVPRALRLLRRAAAVRPGHVGTAAVLCSTLRQAGQPAEALKVAERHGASPYQPLLTSRAAALCDLGRWEEAHRLIRRVIATTKGKPAEEALSVRIRIRSNAPQLFR
jgi:predicted Zn-dependent protease